MKYTKGEIFFPFIFIIHLALWFLDIKRLNIDATPMRITGEIFGSWVLTVIAFNLLMTTRAKWVENFFGGLDKMLIVHRRAALVAFIILIIHLIIVPKVEFFHIGKPLGVTAAALLFLGIIISAAPPLKVKIPYHRWLPMHRLMGFFFFLGIIHMLNSPTILSDLVIIRFYVFIIAIMGITSWLYRTFLYNFFRSPKKYIVEGIVNRGTEVLEIDLKPSGKNLVYQAGQFALVTFPNINVREAHPFTISCGSLSNNLRLSIKALGDYTDNLTESLKVGHSAEIDGPYGRFTQEDIRSKRQIWIAGGIGITPFLSFIDELTPDIEVVLYWSVKNESDFGYDKEILLKKEKLPTFQYNLWNSDEKGHLSIDDIGDRDFLQSCDFLICGPSSLKDALISQLKRKDVSMKQVHSEEFSFR